MGNYASCVLLGSNTKHGKATEAAAKAIFPGGVIRSFYEPITAAEVMLEKPDCFIVDSKSFQIGRRLSPLGADEELEMGSVYVLFPKQRLNSVVNTADMGALFLAAKRGSKVDMGSSKDRLQEAPLSRLKSSFEDIEELFSPELKHMLSKCRSRKPVLETIAE